MYIMCASDVHGARLDVHHVHLRCTCQIMLCICDMCTCHMSVAGHCAIVLLLRSAAPTALCKALAMLALAMCVQACIRACVKGCVGLV